MMGVPNMKSGVKKLWLLR